MSDSLQIRVPLSPSQTEPVRLWADRVNKSALPRMGKIQVLGTSLRANAYDLAELLRVADQRQSNEFDLYKLRVSAIRSVEASLVRRKNRVTIRSLKSALADLRKVTMGELREDILKLHEVDATPDLLELAP